MHDDFPVCCPAFTSARMMSKRRWNSPGLWLYRAARRCSGVVWGRARVADDGGRTGKERPARAPREASGGLADAAAPLYFR